MLLSERGLLELAEEVRLENRVDHEKFEIKLNCVVAVETLLLELWILDLVLEVASEIVVLMTSDIRLSEVRIPENVVIQGKSSSVESVDNRDFKITPDVTKWDVRISAEMNSLAEPFLCLDELSCDVLDRVANPLE